jgi:hypothetical protein
MRFKVQYWLKSELIDTSTTEVIFNNTSDLKDWLKPKLDNKNLDDYNWTILLDKTDVGEGHYTILHSENNLNDLIARMDNNPKYKNWVKPYAQQIRALLNI